MRRQLPAVLEIILLKFSEMVAGSRYTVTTPTNYVIVTTGAVLVFQTIGTDWSLSGQATRIILSVGIAYGSNVRQAMRLLEEAARENRDVLDDPAPPVIFEVFGDNSLGLMLRCFVASTDLRYPTISARNQAINDKFNAAGIVIAFPQRDLHLYTTRPLQVELRRAKEDLADG